MFPGSNGAFSELNPQCVPHDIPPRELPLQPECRLHHAAGKDAAAVGIWENEYTGRKHARLQIITLAELFQNKIPDIPWVDTSVVKKAKREDTGKQGSLL